MTWLRLVRWPNLLIILLTQLAVWWCVILPLRALDIALLLTPVRFALLCFSTLLIAAAGYIINDYFDIRIDAINKPDKVILDKIIPRRKAILAHVILNGLALVSAALVAVPAHHPEWLLLQMLCIILLWKYSTTWKRQFMTGNIVVALMTALTVLALMIYEPATTRYNGFVWETKTGAAYNPAFVISVLSLFAFLLTWIREIIKDMEDFDGDVAEGCVTMPVRLGMSATKRFVAALTGITILFLAAICLLLSRGIFTAKMLGGYLVIALILPLLWCLKTLFKIASKAHYTTLSRRLKIIMVLGIFSLVLYWSLHV